MKKCIGFVLNNWAKLWTLLLLTVLVISLSRACNLFAQTIHRGSIRLDVDVSGIPDRLDVDVSGVPDRLDVDITDVPYLLGNFH